MKKITIIQSSLRENGNTQVVCRDFEKKLQDKSVEVQYFDLKDVAMEFCDGRSLDAYPQNIQDVYTFLESSDIIIFGMPVYQYSMS